MLSLNRGLSLFGLHRSQGGSGFTADTYKFELRYAPVQAFKLRGSFNRAVRAPNITELFAAQALGNVSGQDPSPRAPRIPDASLELTAFAAA